MSRKSLKRSWYKDPALWTLIGVNVFVAITATLQDWEFVTALWVYWGQSIAIGVVSCIRILVGDSKTEYGFGFFDTVIRFLENSVSTGVFLLHYGGFHLVYFIVLRDVFGLPASAEYHSIAVGSTLFFLHHLYTLFQHRRFGVGQPMNPYTRILPMHSTLVLFPLVRDVLLLFLLIRMFVDVSLHVLEHRSTTESR